METALHGADGVTPPGAAPQHDLASAAAVSPERIGAKRYPVMVSALIGVGIFFALSELCVRSFVGTNADTGMLLLGRVALLPYRPLAGAATAAWDHAGASTYTVRDDELGWSILPNGAADQYTANAHGLRGVQNWTTTAAIPSGTFRISVYGDSFTHGDGLPLQDTWPDQLQHMRENLEVLNFGVPGYGTDQAFLRFRRDGTKFQSQVHILGIWPEDLVRNLNVIRFYLNPGGWLGTSKPRFVLEHGNLVTVNSPVLSKADFLDTVLQRQVAAPLARDLWYREDEQRFPFYFHAQSVRAALSVLNAYRRRTLRNRLYLDADGEAVQTTAAIAEAFTSEVDALGARAYVLIVPMKELLDVEGRGAFPLVGVLAARSVPVIDLGPVFAARAREAGAETLYLPDGHLTPAGNRLIAEELLRDVPMELDAANAAVGIATARTSP